MNLTCPLTRGRCRRKACLANRRRCEREEWRSALDPASLLIVAERMLDELDKPFVDRRKVRAHAEKLAGYIAAHAALGGGTERWRRLGLTATQARLMYALELRKGRYVSAEDLLGILHPDGREYSESLITVLISQARKRLAGHPVTIKTCRSAGFELIEGPVRC